MRTRMRRTDIGPTSPPPGGTVSVRLSLSIYSNVRCVSCCSIKSYVSNRTQPDTVSGQCPTSVRTMSGVMSGVRLAVTAKNHHYGVRSYADTSRRMSRRKGNV